MSDGGHPLGVLDEGAPEAPEEGEGGEEEEIPGDAVEEPELVPVDERAWFD